MHAIFTIAKKELKDSFFSPIAYVFITVFLFLSFWFFFSNFFLIAQANLRTFFGPAPLLLLVFLPSISMSRWSEEKKSGTLEILLTLPVRDIEVVLGKFLSSLLFFSIVLILTLPLIFIVALLGDIDPGPVVGGYLGLFFLGSACLAVGLFISSLTENQIIAFIITVVVLFILYLMGESIFLNYIPEALKPVFSSLSLSNHFESLSRGVIDSRDLIYYLSLTGFFIYLNQLSLESRRWH